MHIHWAKERDYLVAGVLLFIGSTVAGRSLGMAAGNISASILNFFGTPITSVNFVRDMVSYGTFLLLGYLLFRLIVAKLIVQGRAALPSKSEALSGLEVSFSREAGISSQLSSKEDRLEAYWKGIIWGSLFIPGAIGMVAVLSSFMYYDWRETWPNKASEINRHAWGAVLVWLLLARFIFLLMRSR